MGLKFLFQNKIKQDKGCINFEKPHGVNLRHLEKLDLENSQTSLFLFWSAPAALSDGCLQFLIYQSSFYNKTIPFVKYNICQTVIKSSLWASITMKNITACETCFQQLLERYWRSVSWQDKIYVLFFGLLTQNNVDLKRQDMGFHRIMNF